MRVTSELTCRDGVMSNSEVSLSSHAYVACTFVFRVICETDLWVPLEQEIRFQSPVFNQCLPTNWASPLA